MKIFNAMGLIDQHVTIHRAENVWQLMSEDGTLVAEASNTSKLSKYAMDRGGAKACTTRPWPGYHWREDI